MLSHPDLSLHTYLNNLYFTLHINRNKITAQHSSAMFNVNANVRQRIF